MRPMRWLRSHLPAGGLVRKVWSAAELQGQWELCGERLQVLGSTAAQLQAQQGDPEAGATWALWLRIRLAAEDGRLVAGAQATHADRSCPGIPLHNLIVFLG